MSADAYRTMRQAMLRRIAEEQAGREHQARCRQQSAESCGRIVTTALIAVCAALIAYLTVQP